MRPEMARRRNALPLISEPTWKAENISSFEQAESRRGSVGSVRESSELKKVMVSTNGSSDLSERSCQPIQRYKLSVIGDSGCGKTCLLNALVRSEFDTEESCIFDECVTDVTTGSSRVEFMLWDISGLEDYESIRKEMYRDSDVLLLCFDIGHPPSLRSVVDKWLPEISDACPGVPFLLIGCKNDLRTDSALQYYLTVPGHDIEDVDSISRVKALSVAQSIMARDYIECCAKTRWNIKEVFRGAADAILHKDDPKGGESKPPSMLRKFPWFTRRPSALDMSDYNSVSRTVSGSRRLSLFSTS